MNEPHLQQQDGVPICVHTDNLSCKMLDTETTQSGVIMFRLTVDVALV